MKKTILFSIAVLLSCFACKKNSPSNRGVSDPLIENAKTYFEESVVSRESLSNSAAPLQLNPRFAPRTVLWGKAVTRQIGSTKIVVAPLSYSQSFYTGTNNDPRRMYAASDVTMLLVYTDRNNVYHAEQVTYFPDSNFAARASFSGLISIDDWQGNALNKYRVEKTGRVSKWNGTIASDTLSRTTTNGIEENVTYTMETCYEIYGVNYSADEPEKLYPWTQVAGCTYMVVSDGYDDVGSSATLTPSQYASSATAASTGGAITPTIAVTIVSGTNVIANINDYDKCFTNIAGSGNTYNITVCVSEPIPSKRTAWGLTGTGSSGTGNPINVGHTFMILTQTYGGGTITRNVGFYPQGAVTPLSPVSQGSLNNDASHGYNISLSITVTNSQFFEVLNAISQGNTAGYLYNLNSNNCTTFTIDALRTAGISLPSTIGTWPGGSGNDPGDLGEDIRTMSLASGMTRATTSVAHPNLGVCN